MSLTPPHLRELNAAQKEAVCHTRGALLVLAGAGAGKTRVITHRIAHLVHQGVAPRNILAVTFTNKAATEMRDRANELLRAFPPSNRALLEQSPTVATFHALSARLLREHHKTLNLPRHFSIYDQSDSLKVIKACLEKAGYDPKQWEPRRILSRISRAKSSAENRQDINQNPRSALDEVAGVAWGHYQTRLKEEGALDFDDLLVKTFWLLKDHPAIRDAIRARYQYLHVDEYQDTNDIQLRLAKMIAGDVKNICAVGDIDQSIYSWRGANIANVLAFERHFAGAKVVLLEENYRSTKTIIAASNQVIAKNTQRVEKNVFTNNGAGETITCYHAVNGIDEAEHVALAAKNLLREGVPANEVAVLFRANFQSRVLEEAFLSMEVPYQVVGAKFFERKEVKDVLAFLRLAVLPNNTDLARVVNVPPRGIGKVTLLKLLNGQRATLTGVTATRVAAFDQLLKSITNQARKKPISHTLRFIIEQTGLQKHFTKSDTEDDLERLENLRELVSLATRFDELDPEAGVEALLEQAALQSDQDELDEQAKEAARLMTVHAAKGLEFSHVFITGLEEGLFPHERLDVSQSDHEEERRLFYVALTRAKKRVWLSHAHTRAIFGQTVVNVPSSFLSDIDDAYISHVGGGQTPHASTGSETVIYLT